MRRKQIPSKGKKGGVGLVGWVSKRRQRWQYDKKTEGPTMVTGFSLEGKGGRSSFPKGLKIGDGKMAYGSKSRQFLGEKGGRPIYSAVVSLLRSGGKMT